MVPAFAAAAAMLADPPAAAAAASAPAPATSQSPEACVPPPPGPDHQEIVVCAVKPDGYRLNPDVMKARRELRNGGHPVRPGQVPSGTDCATVGPMGCRGVPTVNLIGVAATAAEVSQRLAKGQEVGSVFVTDPHPSEYQLYLRSKKEREEKEADKAAAIALAKARARPPATAPAVPPSPPQQDPPTKAAGQSSP